MAELQSISPVDLFENAKTSTHFRRRTSESIHAKRYRRHTSESELDERADSGPDSMLTTTDNCCINS